MQPKGSESTVEVYPLRDIRALPKAHLHLHLTGSMRLSTLHELAAAYGITLPPALRGRWTQPHTLLGSAG